MGRFNKNTVVAVILCLVLSPCVAAASDAKALFFDTLYGGITGGLIGAAVMAFTKQPVKHLEYIGYGVAGGALAGVAYGTVRTARSLAEVENGKVRFAIPAVIPDIGESNSRGKTPIVFMAQLVHGKF